MDMQTSNHAAAETAVGDILIDVEDDGVGFNPQTTNLGIGLVHMHERTESIKGTFALTTSPGKVQK